MTVLAYLIPISLLLGGLGLGFFLYTLRSGQYDDPEGNAQRILSDAFDDRPKGASAPAADRTPSRRS